MSAAEEAPRPLTPEERAELERELVDAERKVSETWMRAEAAFERYQRSTTHATDEHDWSRYAAVQADHKRALERAAEVRSRVSADRGASS